jgi:beta-galactosidase
MLGNQLICGWTWQSMHAGEEQFLEGMVDWDGQTQPQIRRIQDHCGGVPEDRIASGSPIKPRPEVALAFSFPSQIASGSFPEPHDEQVQTAFTCFNQRNVDTRVVDLDPESSCDYKLLVVPGVTRSWTKPAAGKIREFVRGGGTAVMTGYSAMLDERGQVFATTPLPGRLSDVFGIRVSGFEEPECMNELSRDGSAMGNNCA